LMLSEAEQVGKLQAAVAARRNPDTVIVARTSVLSELPRAEALARIRAYSATGVGALMFPELPGGAADLPDVAAATQLPISVLGLPAAVFEGAALVAASRRRIRFLPHLPYRMVVQALVDAFDHLAAGGEMDSMGERVAPEALLRRVDRSAEMQAWQDRFVRG